MSTIIAAYKALKAGKKVRYSGGGAGRVSLNESERMQWENGDMLTIGEHILDGWIIEEPEPEEQPSPGEGWEFCNKDDAEECRVLGGWIQITDSCSWGERDASHFEFRRRVGPEPAGRFLKEGE